MRLRIRNLLASASLLATALAAPMVQAASTADMAAPRPADAQRLLRAVTVQGIMEHQRAFQRIANRNGGTRAAGTPGYARSAEYVARWLNAAGYDVRVQTFDFAFFRELAPATLAQVSPTPTTYREGTDFRTMDYSGSGNASGRLVPIDVQIPPAAEPSSTSGCEPTDFPAPPAAGSIALIQRGTCTFFDKATNAANAGYAAAIIFNEGQPGRTDLLLGTLGEPVRIPVLGTTFALGRDLVLAARTGPVVVSLTTRTESEIRPTRNVIADSPYGRGDRVVLVGAHLDSVLEGPGINDNGSGSSTILEVVEALQQVGLRTRNRLRFAFWGAEEAGLLGSQYYVDNLPAAERRKILLNLNFDMLGSPNFVRFVYDGDGSATPDDPDDAGPLGSAAIERLFLNYFRGRGLATSPTAFDGRSDYGPFIAVGIPAGGLFTGAEGIKTAREARIYGGQAGIAYDPCYHQACDTTRNLSRQALDQMSDAVAYAVLTTGGWTGFAAPSLVAQEQAAAKRAAWLYRGDKLQR